MPAPVVLTKCSDSLPARRRLQRPIADPSEMPGVSQGNHADAGSRTLLDAQFDGLLADGLPETKLPIDNCQHVAFNLNPNRLIGLNLATAQPLHIRQHADHPMRIVAHQVRLNQMFRDPPRLRRLAAGIREDCGGRKRRK